MTSKKNFVMPLLFVGCLALLPATSYAQKSGNACQIERKYDRQANVTTVECALLETFAPPIRLMVQANASFPGKFPNDAAKLYFTLSAFRGDANRRTLPLFKGENVLLLNLGATELEVQVTGFRLEYFEMNRLISEQASVVINRDDLPKLLEAQSLQGKWGNTTFALSESSLAALKAFIAEQALATSSQ